MVRINLVSGWLVVMHIYLYFFPLLINHWQRPDINVSLVVVAALNAAH